MNKRVASSRSAASPLGIPAAGCEEQAFDNEAELLEALEVDDREAATVPVEKDPENPWTVIELLLNGEFVYAVFNGASGRISEKATHNRLLARAAADRLNQESRTRQPRTPHP